MNHPSEPSKEVKDGPSIHIQVIQSSVAYNHVLSLIPLIHGINPSAPEAKIYLDPNGPQPDTETKIGPQGNGSPFPEGYPISLPAKGKFDLVLHIGVGSRGNIEIEKLAHKRGYQIPDVVGQKAPIATNQSATTSRTSEKSESQKREEARSLSKKEEQSSSASEEAVRGFGKGYEAYQEEEVNSNNVTGLVEWLQQECQIKNVKQSHDAGRYLCDFIVSPIQWRLCTSFLLLISDLVNCFSTTALCVNQNEEGLVPRYNLFTYRLLVNHNLQKNVKQRFKRSSGGYFVEVDEHSDVYKKDTTAIQ